ncbi:unnamed protein product [Schistocephalus solidus]|uniref:Uncharacterized protein n=1 Tax=Schistocephalus solidus TaxID=70667 RepID=A0A183T322_SCHSO|nr:unnamed protein product [Schistocephalus solidus]
MLGLTSSAAGHGSQIVKIRRRHIHTKKNIIRIHPSRHTNRAARKLEDLHASDDNSTIEPRRYQLRTVIQSTAPILRMRTRQYLDWFYPNEAESKKLLTEKNQLNKTYMDLQNYANKAAFFRYCRLVLFE